jgi:TRAP-type C4-dicarboxylate transport system permease small subunit
LTTLLPLLFLKGSLLNFADKSGSVIKVTFNGVVRYTEGQGSIMTERLLPLSVIIILISALSLITIFLYKNRKLQLLFALLINILVAGLIILLGYYSWMVISSSGVSIVPGIKTFLPIVILGFALLAYRGILKDDRLIKSYDRLR